MNNRLQVSAEIVSLFEGMACRFDGVPFEFSVQRPYRYGVYGEGLEIQCLPLVETLDGTRHQQEDCHRILCSDYDPHSRWMESRWYTNDQLKAEEDAENIRYCDEADAYALAACAKWCEHNGTWEHVSGVEYFDGEWYLLRHEMLSVDGHGDAFLTGDPDYVYCRDIGEHFYMDNCHECDGEWTYGDEADCACCNQPDDRVLRYHRHGRTPDLFRGSSKWLVGFEIEKNSVAGADSEGDQIDETPLIAYWETDGSCGIEGVTHAYDPLDPVTVKKFANDLEEASSMVDVPCNDSCGGHINLSYEFLSPRALMQSFKKYAPLWYSVYRNRLTNAFCRNDKKIEHGTDKYSPVITKDFGIEIRLPSRVRNSEQLTRRFEWVGVTCTAIDQDISFNAYVKACRTVLFEGAYNSNRIQYAKVLRLARKFRVWMLDGIADQSIHQWI